MNPDLNPPCSCAPFCISPHTILCGAMPPPCPVSCLNAVNNLLHPTINGGYAVPFESNTVSLGQDISHAPASCDFLIKRSGYYEIFYHATITSLDSITKEVGAMLCLNGITLSASYSEDALSPLHPTALLSGLAIAHVDAPATLSLMNAADDTLYAAATLYIKRLM